MQKFPKRCVHFFIIHMFARSFLVSGTWSSFAPNKRFSIWVGRLRLAPGAFVLHSLGARIFSTTMLSEMRMILRAVCSVLVMAPPRVWLLPSWNTMPCFEDSFGFTPTISLFTYVLATALYFVLLFRHDPIFIQQTSCTWNCPPAMPRCLGQGVFLFYIVK